MKKICIAIFLGMTAFAYAQDISLINFNTEQSWQQVLEQANKEHKIVFVDLYTDWCVPCKRMEKEVFLLKNVADTFNTKFVNYRINAEKREGVDIAKRYSVSGYPYFIFVDGNGTLYYSMLGYREERQLLQDAAVAFKELNDPKPFGLWKEEYDAKRYDVSWLRDYLQKRNKLRMDNTQLLEDYYNLLKPSEYVKAENIQLVINSSGIKLNGKVFKILTKNFTAISSKEDSLYHLQEHLLNIFESTINKIAVKAIADKDEAALLHDVVPAHAAFPESVRFMPWYNKQETNWKFTFYLHTNNLEKGLPVAIEYINKSYKKIGVSQIKRKDSVIYKNVLAVYKAKGLDSQQLKNVMPMLEHYFKSYETNDYLEKLLGASNLVYNNTSNPMKLNIALGWTKRALEIQESSATLELMSKIIYHLNRKQESITVMQSAIEKADNSSDQKRLTLLLNNMKEDKMI